MPKDLVIDSTRRVYSATMMGELIRVTVKPTESNQECKALVDTGASKSSVSEEFIKKHKLLMDINTKDIYYIKIAGGSIVQTIGTIFLQLNIGPVSCTHQEFIIIPGDVSEEIILGNDFFSNNNVKIKTKHHTLIIPDDNGNEIRISTQPKQTVFQKVNCKVAQQVHLTTPGETYKVSVECPSQISNKKTLLYYSDEDISMKLKPDIEIYPGIGEFNENPEVLVSLSGTEGKVLRPGDIIGSFMTVYECLDTDDEDINDTNKQSEPLPDFEHFRNQIDLNTLSQEDKEKVLTTLKSVQAVFSTGPTDIGNASVTKHKILLLDDTPIYQRPRPIPPPVAKEVETLIADLLSNDIIEPSKSPWSSPIVVLRKPDGGIRMCIDYRQLNTVTKNDKFPIPNLTSSVYSLKGVKYFTCLDLVQGYYQLSIHSDSREYTAFSTPRGHYQFKRLSFGLKNAPSAFQREIQTILQEFPTNKVIVYIDDILILGNSFEEHLSLVYKVLTTLWRYNVKIKLPKCHWFCEEVDFLGHHITRTGLSKQTKYIEKVSKFPKPTTVKELREFLGLINFQRKFVPFCSSLQKPLSQYTGGKSKAKIEWNPQMEEAFEKLKELMKEDFELSFPDYSETANQLELYVDASNNGAGACLAQKQENETKIIAYASMEFTDTQKRYSTLDRELAAIRWGIKSFKAFLYGIEFILWTDHQPLIYLNNMKLIDNRLARTLENLSDFNFIIKYIPGKQNLAADSLSRIPIVEPSIPVITEQNTKELPDGLIINGNAVPGGPNSMVLSLMKCLQTSELDNTRIPKDDSELRSILVDELLKHPERYKLEINRITKKQIELMRHRNQLPILEMLLAACSIFEIIIHLHFGSDQPLIYQSYDTKRKENTSSPIIHMQCIGGIHFNPLIETRKYTQVNTNSCITQTTYPLEMSKPNLKGKVYAEEVVIPGCSHFSVGPNPQPILQVTCENRNWCTLLDTGSEISLVRTSVIDKLQKEKLISTDIVPTTIQVRGVDGTLSPVEGIVNLPIEWPNKSDNLSQSMHAFIVVPDDFIPCCLLIGLDIMNTIDLELDFQQQKCFITNLGNASKTKLSNFLWTTTPAVLPTILPVTTAETQAQEPSKLVIATHAEVNTVIAQLKELDSGSIPEVDINTIPNNTETNNNTNTNNQINSENEKKEKRTKSDNYEINTLEDNNKLCNNYNNDHLFEWESQLRNLGLSMEQDDIRHLQQTSSNIRRLKKHLEDGDSESTWPECLSGFKRHVSNLKIIDGVLYYLTNMKRLFVIDFRTLVNFAITVHFKMGHVGRDKMIHLVGQYFWHHSTYKVVNDVSTTCSECQILKVGAQRIMPPTFKITTAYPFELVAADIVLFPRTRSGNIGCLILVDHYSKWATAVPIKNKTSSTVTNIMTNNIFPTLIRRPSRILTDNGPEFSADLFQEAMLNAGVKHLYTTPYRPSSNGAVERLNRTIGQLLRSVVEDPSKWDENLASVLRIYNSTLHAETGMSPSSCILSKSHEVTDPVVLDTQEQERWKVGHPSFASFRRGTKVIKKVENKGNLTLSKLKPYYHGPYKISKVQSNGVTYVLNGPNGDIRAHHTQLKEWHDPPAYLLRLQLYKELANVSETESEDDPLPLKENPGYFSMDSSTDASSDDSDSSEDEIFISKMARVTNYKGSLKSPLMKDKSTQTLPIPELKLEELTQTPVASASASTTTSNEQFHTRSSVHTQISQINPETRLTKIEHSLEEINESISGLEKFIEQMCESLQESFCGFTPVRLEPGSRVTSTPIHCNITSAPEDVRPSPVQSPIKHPRLKGIQQSLNIYNLRSSGSIP